MRFVVYLFLAFGYYHLVGRVAFAGWADLPVTSVASISSTLVLCLLSSSRKSQGATLPKAKSKLVLEGLPLRFPSFVINFNGAKGTLVLQVRESLMSQNNRADNDVYLQSFSAVPT